MSKNDELRIIKLFSKKEKSKCVIMTVKTEFSKMVYNIKRTKRETLQKEIITAGDYDYIILETLNKYTAEEKQNRFVYWKNNHIDMLKFRTIIGIKTIEENKNRINELEKIGAIGEKHINHILINVFLSNIKQSVFKFSTFDFYNDNGFIFEFKKRQIRCDLYESALINFSKSKNTTRNIIFVYQYEDGLFYIQYEEELFDTFSIEYNKKVNGLLKQQDVLHIPKKYLIPFYEYSKIELIKKYNTIEDETKFNNLIYTDKYLASISTTKKLIL